MSNIHDIKKLLSAKVRSDGPFSPIDSLFNPIVGRYNIVFVDGLNKPITLPKQTLVYFRYSRSARTMPTYLLQ